MFNSRNTTISCFIIVLVFAIFGLFLDNSWLLVAGILLLIVCVALFVLGAIYIQWNFYFFSHSHGGRDVPTVAITFDDGTDGKTTPEILAVLEKYNIKATFFCIGERIVKNPEVFKSIAAKGHIVGNHSYNHSFWFDLYSYNRMADEILKTDEIIFEFTGKKPKLFRPPYGVTNPMLKKALKITGHHSIAWSLRSFDTVKNPENVLRKVNSKLRNGDIILFHDTVPQTSGIVEKFILETHKSGKKFVSLDELINIQPYDFEK